MSFAFLTQAHFNTEPSSAEGAFIKHACVVEPKAVLRSVGSQPTVKQII